MTDSTLVFGDALKSRYASESVGGDQMDAKKARMKMA
jgi:hypothetical protein